MTRRAYFIGSIEYYGGRAGLVLNFMKNDILKISGVSFSSFSYFWLTVWARTGFRGNFKHFNERMQKESLRGRGNDQFGHSSKLNLEVSKMMKMIIFRILPLKSNMKPGSLRDHPGAFLILINDS